MLQRIKWVDWLKFIGILSIIFGHIDSPFGTFIFSWHMPLFFFIAGFFIKFEGKFKDFFKKNFYRLMLPYFIFSFVGLLAGIIKNYLLHRPDLNILYELKGIFISMDMASLMNHYGFVLWFLPSLFVVKLLLYVINKYSTNIFINFSIVLSLFFLSFYVDLPFAIDNAFNAFLWTYFGFLFFKYLKNLDVVLWFGLVLFLVLSIFFKVPDLNIATKLYGNVILNIFWALSFLSILILFSKKILDKYFSQLTSMWASNTMILFILHPYTNNAAYIFVEHWGLNSWILKFVLTLVLLQVVLFVKSKYKNNFFFRYV